MLFSALDCLSVREAMSVTLEPLVGSDIPETMRAPDVKTVWAVMANGTVMKYFYSKDEALGFAAHLEELEEARRPSFSRGPGM